MLQTCKYACPTFHNGFKIIIPIFRPNIYTCLNICLMQFLKKMFDNVFNITSKGKKGYIECDFDFVGTHYDFIVVVFL